MSKQYIIVLAIGCVLSVVSLLTSENIPKKEDNEDQTRNLTVTSQIEELVRKWAPKIWLAPNEQFYPLSVTEFLEHVTIIRQNGSTQPQSFYLRTKKNMEELLSNRSSFLYGRDPSRETIPLYVVIEICDISKQLRFHVTYWFFYPFSEGKRICTLDFGILGPFPIPLLFNRCYGRWRTFGSHVGDWEHISVFFNPEPEQIYLSTHDSGAYYHLNHTTNQFVYWKQESRTRRGLLLQKPNFPERIRRNADDGRPVLFSAKGSHGFWSEPGRHKFTRLARLYDLNGYGTPWNTWKGQFHYVFADRTQTWPIWFRFLGRWGNPKSHCYFLSYFGLDVCHFVDGPTGIPLKKSNFQCST